MFVNCDLARNVWCRISNRLKWKIVLPRNPSLLFLKFIFFKRYGEAYGGVCVLSCCGMDHFEGPNEIVFSGSSINMKKVEGRSIFLV